ncbi:hypothetical protein [Streptomyces sp. GbtcB7]|uniref:hypothetical protein n=1 Tax=Streptomyces sp. GbtcB7 TaxID=2824752 RepID=UPI001C2FA953|nr:hypothetical protein [Streptomyces sp. GbtcB7]
MNASVAYKTTVQPFAQVGQVGHRISLKCTQLVKLMALAMQLPTGRRDFPGRQHRQRG